MQVSGSADPSSRSTISSSSLLRRYNPRPLIHFGTNITYSFRDVRIHFPAGLSFASGGTRRVEVPPFPVSYFTLVTHMFTFNGYSLGRGAPIVYGSACGHQDNVAIILEPRFRIDGFKVPVSADARPSSQTR